MRTSGTRSRSVECKLKLMELNGVCNVETADSCLETFMLTAFASLLVIYFCFFFFGVVMYLGDVPMLFVSESIPRM